MRPSRSSASASRSRPDAPCWPISASPLPAASSSTSSAPACARCWS